MQTLSEYCKREVRKEVTASTYSKKELDKEAKSQAAGVNSKVCSWSIRITDKGTATLVVLTTNGDTIHCAL